MVQVLPLSYNTNNNTANDHYKQPYMNSNEYTNPPPPPPPPQMQQVHIPMPVPMINIMPPHPHPHHPPHPHHHQPNFFHPSHVPPPPPPIYQDQSNAQYMEYVGSYHPTMPFMQQGYYSDITVYVPTLQKQFPLHTNILSRSPVLHQRILEEQSNTMELDLYILQETFNVVISHLNRPMTPQEVVFYATEKPQIAIELLEACEELGLENLLEALLLALNQNLTHPKVAMTYIEAMEPYQPLEEEEPRRWVELLEEDVVLFMVKTLSSQLEAFSTSVKVSGNVVIGQINACGYMPSRIPAMRGLMDLARAYAALPQHLMIRCLEHAQLPVQDAIQRSHFAQKVLAIFNSTNSFQHRGQADLMAVMRFENGVDTIAVVRQTNLKKGCWDPTLYDL